MAKDGGGPAFPVIASNGLGHVTDGMSLRDWFAGQALATLAGPDMFTAFKKLTDSTGNQVKNLLAQAAYEIADAMLKEREK